MTQSPVFRAIGFASICTALLLACETRPEKPLVLGRIDSVVTPPPAQPHFDSALLLRARQSIDDYLQLNTIGARRDPPQFEQCYQNFTAKPPGTLLGVARARVLDAQPVGPARGPQPDTMTVLAEMLVVARAGPGDPADTTWKVQQRVHLDSVRLTLVANRNRPDIEWGLCWDGYQATDFPGPPAFLHAADSTPPELEWMPPLTGWASLQRLADSARWSSVRLLENDSAVKRAIASGTFANRLGILLNTREGQNCLTIADSTLPPGTPILAVSPDSPESSVQGLIEARRSHECRRGGDEWGSVVMNHASFYDVIFPPGVIGGGVVVAARPNALHKENGVFKIDVDGDGRPENFTSCTSMEGTHEIVQTGSGPAAIKRWEAYIYVPYDLEPTCGK